MATEGDCLLIQADNVVLDLNGFSVTGDNSGTDYGIYALNKTNITVKNFKNVTDFLHGVYFFNVSNHVMTSEGLRGFNSNTVSKYRLRKRKTYLTNVIPQANQTPK
jgi:hypothetical protein